MPLLKHSRVRYISPPQPVTTPSKFPGRVTIRELSDDVFLNIFRYYLDVSPQQWHRLVHICRRWRRIVFASQRTLSLRIFCTHGTPVSETLHCWSAVPIVVQYGGSLEPGLPTLEGEVNIMATLKQSDRVSSINLTATSPLLKKLATIERPFSELVDLVLFSRDGVRQTFPSAFRWGLRLRRLHLTRIAIPSLIRLLYSSRNLVDLQLHEDSIRFPPEALTHALSGMAKLRSLSLHFLSTNDYRVLPPESPESCGRTVLPVLTRLDFRGNFRYLEGLVARTDAPRLGDIEFTFFNDISFPTWALGDFLDRTEIYKSHCRAYILSSERAISISLIRPGASACLKLQLLCKSLRDQLFSMDLICNNVFFPLSNVKDLRIGMTRPSSEQDDGYRERWLMRTWMRIIHTFTHAKWLCVAGNLSTNKYFSLPLSDLGRATLLLALKRPCITEPALHYAPSLDAVASVTNSRQLPGHIMYERPWINELHGAGEPFSQQITFEMLPDDVLRNIFHHHLTASEQFWHTLCHVCRRWRQIVFTSPLGLGLRLYCTYGTPVLKTLDCWPALPIVLQYGGSPTLDPPAPEDEENIVAALKHCDRVSSISLTITISLLEKLFVEAPYSELEELVLFSRDSDTVQLTLSNTFRWGPRLRTLHSTRIAIPALPQCLAPSMGLVDIQLHEIPRIGYFHPEAFADALSEATQLETLSLHFLSLPSRRSYLSLPPPSGERVVLPALTCFRYRGTSKYLDNFVARIDAPRLGDIDITLFSQPTMDASQLGRFIERIEIQTPLSRADVQTSAHAISISVSNSSTSIPLRLHISCQQLDWQLSCMAQVCVQFSPFLFRVNNLRIRMMQSSSVQDDVDGEQWLELLRAFGGVTNFPVTGKLTTAILCALGVEEGHTTVLPSLRHLHIENRMAMDLNEGSWGALLSFITLRSRSGHPVQVNVTFNQCHICHASFRQQKELDSHLVGKHAYRISCSYCGDFEPKAGQHESFRDHLESEHPEVRRKDARIWSSLTPFQLDSLVYRNSLLRAPDTIAPSTTITAPHSR